MLAQRASLALQNAFVNAATEVSSGGLKRSASEIEERSSDMQRRAFRELLAAAEVIAVDVDDVRAGS